jgi:hypothetical protein
VSTTVLLTVAEGRKLAKPVVLYSKLRYPEALKKARQYRVLRYLNRRTGEIFEPREADTAGCAYTNPELYDRINRSELLEVVSYAIPVDASDLVLYEPVEQG